LQVVEDELLSRGLNVASFSLGASRSDKEVNQAIDQLLLSGKKVILMAIDAAHLNCNW
jgi:hypothetical protein